MTPVVTKTGSVVTSNVQFSADVSTMFLGVMGKSSMTITGSSTSTTSMPLYVDFYLLMDNSPSMGVGATPTDVATMVDNTPDKCAFACHDTVDTEQLLQARQNPRRDDADRRAAHGDPAADGHRGGDADLFEPVPDGDLRLRRLGGLRRSAGAVFAVVVADERQDRRRQYRPDDRQRPEPEQRPGYPVHQHFSGDQHRDHSTGSRTRRRSR